MKRPEWILAICAYACLGIIALTGCASARFATESGRNKQLALTGLIAVDSAQTVTIARSSCLYEADPIAAAVFGTTTPSPERVLATNALYMLGHWQLGAYLDRKSAAPVDFSIDAQADVARKNRWRRLRNLYQFLTLIGHGSAVAHNQSKGIKPFSSYDCQ